MFIWVSAFCKLLDGPRLVAQQHFYDSGLLCHLLGIQTPDQIRSHPLRGAIFESWAASGILKQRLHRGVRPQAFHLREVAGLEVDLLVQDGPDLTVLETKSGQTFDASFLAGLKGFQEPLAAALPGARLKAVLLYGGDQSQARQDIRILPWRDLEQLAPAAE